MDTGSTTTLISSDLYQRLPRYSPLGPGPIILGLGSQRLDVRGSTSVKIADIVHTVVVIEDMDYELLLRMDFLKMCVIDIPQRQITIGDQKFPLVQRSEYISSVQKIYIEIWSFVLFVMTV